jgi:hypothetical protein
VPCTHHGDARHPPRQGAVSDRSPDLPRPNVGN